jgi:hypothetical protein
MTESVADMSGTECSASQTTVSANPLTLLIVGHTHEYSHESSDKEIINGIGGAPLTSGTEYGYSVDYSTGSTIDSFKINADGTAG